MAEPITEKHARPHKDTKDNNPRMKEKEKAASPKKPLEFDKKVI
jgi:hypothetical protein